MKGKLKLRLNGDWASRKGKKYEVFINQQSVGEISRQNPEFIHYLDFGKYTLTIKDGDYERKEVIGIGSRKFIYYVRLFPKVTYSRFFVGAIKGFSFVLFCVLLYSHIFLFKSSVSLTITSFLPLLLLLSIRRKTRETFDLSIK